MRTMQRVIGIFVLLAVAQGVLGAPEVDWGTDVDVFLFQWDGLQLIQGGDQNTGGFVQLIDLGTNAEYDGLSLLSPSGLNPDGDDSVVATAWVGRGLGGDDGEFFVLNTVYNTTNKHFVIRFFEQPSPNYDAGLIPQFGHYGVSPVFSGTTDPVRDEFYIEENLVATSVVPEPGVAAFLLLGAGLALGLRRRRIG